MFYVRCHGITRQCDARFASDLYTTRHFIDYSSAAVVSPMLKYIITKIVRLLMGKHGRTDIIDGEHIQRWIWGEMKKNLFIVLI